MKKFIVSPHFAAIIVSVFVLMILLATSDRLPLTWDEGESVDRVENLLTWFGTDHPLTVQSIEEHWTFTTQIEGHPAGYGIVIALGKTIYPFFPGLNHLFSPKTEYRFGPLLLFTIAVGVVYYQLQDRFSQSVAVFWVLTVLMLPRVFAHLHIAACDSPLLSSWLLCWATFHAAFIPKDNLGFSKNELSTLPPNTLNLKNRDDAGRISAFSVFFMRGVLWGFCLGLTLSMKFTGWIAVIPCFLTVLILPNRKKNLLYRFLPGLFLALIVFLFLNPPLWVDPVQGFRQFFSLNTSRTGFNISILFLGQMYNLDHPLPWYNTIIWVLITIPLGFLLLGFYGVYALFRRSPHLSFGIRFSILINAMILLIVRAIPGTPPHDGVRLFVPAFPFLAMIIAIGATSLFFPTENNRDRAGKMPMFAEFFRSPLLSMKRLTRLFVILVFGFSLFNMFWYSPQWLSYYNAVIGGLDGAKRAGMEPTYYWDALDGEVLHWIASNTDVDELVCFSASSTKNMLLLRKWGELERDFFRRFATDQQGKTIRWYILQRRPSGEYPRDIRLIEQAEPVFRKVIRRGGVGIWRLDDVPLLEIYSFDDFERTQQDEE
ncbi:MAG: hypothetical protein ACRC10_11905 [Thermoguttaceae bacterium]